MVVNHITLVTVPVTDQDRAREFYVDRLGFVPSADYRMARDEAGSAGAGARWLMLAAPGGGPEVILSNWSTPPGSLNAALGCDDADRAHAELIRRGVEPLGPPIDAPWGRWFGIRDPDDNEWLVVQAKESQ